MPEQITSTESKFVENSPITVRKYFAAPICQIVRLNSFIYLETP